MEYKHKIIYSIEGLSAAKLDAQLIVYENESTRAYLVDRNHLNIECEEIDKATAFAVMLLKGKISKSKPFEIDKSLDLGIDEIHKGRESLKAIGAFCVIEIIGEADVNIQEKLHNKIGLIHLCFDAVDKNLIKENNRNIVECILLSISMVNDASTRVHKVIEGISFYPTPEETLYSYTLKGGSVNLVVSRNLDNDKRAEISEYVELIRKERVLNKVVKLYNQSVDKNQDKFRAFIFSWLALEIFINKVFGEYEKIYIEKQKEINEASGLQDFITRTQKVMKSKYRLTDKFTLVVSTIGSDPETQIPKFKEAKKFRDNIFHGEEVDEDSLPLVSTREIVSDMIKNHVGRINT
jgi:hypothetical protein